MRIKNTIRKPIVSSLKMNILIFKELGCLFRELIVLFPNKKLNYSLINCFAIILPFSCTTLTI